jgi:aconitate hydratase
MGVLPLQFKDGVSAQSLELDGTETYDVLGLGTDLKPRQDLKLRINRINGKTDSIEVICRIDTPIEVEYYVHGGIMPYVLRQLISKS